MSEAICFLRRDFNIIFAMISGGGNVNSNADESGVDETKTDRYLMFH